jgi:hypothetical protein
MTAVTGKLQRISRHSNSIKKSVNNQKERFQLRTFTPVPWMNKEPDDPQKKSRNSAANPHNCVPSVVAGLRLIIVTVTAIKNTELLLTSRNVLLISTRTSRTLQACVDYLKLDVVLVQISTL